MAVWIVTVPKAFALPSPPTEMVTGPPIAVPVPKDCADASPLTETVWFEGPPEAADPGRIGSNQKLDT
jgi:hypothetical protein